MQFLLHMLNLKAPKDYCIVYMVHTSRLVSCGHCNTPNLVAEQQNMYSLTVMEARSLKSGVARAVLPLRALGENLSLPLPTLGGSRCFLACGYITLISVFTCLPPLLFVDLSSVSLRRTLVIRAHLENPVWYYFEILNFLCKDFFFGKIIFTGPGG